MEPTLRLRATPERGAIPAKGAHEVTALFTIEAPKDLESERGSLDLVLVVDVSGSMAGARLELLKKTLDVIVDEVTSNDRLAIIAYSDRVNTVLPLSEMDSLGKSRASTAIKGLRANGRTALAAAMIEGVRLLAERSADDRRDMGAVFLLTDGLPTAGPHEEGAIIRWMLRSFAGPISAEARRYLLKSFEPSSYVRLMGYMRRNSLTEVPTDLTEELIAADEAEKGVTYPVPPPPEDLPEAVAAPPADAPFIHTFGFGADHSEALLSAISAKVASSYAFIEGEDQIADAFGTAIGGLLATVATGMRLIVRFAPGVELVRVEGPNDLVWNERSITVRLGDIQASERRDVVIRFRASKKARAGPDSAVPIASASLLFSNVTTHDNECVECELAVARTASALPPPDPAVHLQSLRCQCADALKSAQELADKKGDLAGAQELLRGCKRQVASSRAAVPLEAVPGAALHLRNMDTDLDDALEGTVSAHAFRTRGRQKMLMSWNSHAHQRANATSASYMTPHLMEYATSFKHKASRK